MVLRLNYANQSWLKINQPRVLSTNYITILYFDIIRLYLNSVFPTFSALPWMHGLRLQTLLWMPWKGKGEINFFLHYLFNDVWSQEYLPPSPLRQFIFALNIYSELLISKPPFPSFPPPPPKKGSPVTRGGVVIELFLVSNCVMFP